MADNRETLRHIYDLYVDSGGERVPLIERNLGVASPMAVSEDMRRNERDIYLTMLQDESHPLDRLYFALLPEMRGRSFDLCNEIIDGLSFVQFVAARSLWKQELNVTDAMRRFAVDFDRIDVASERRRLYAIAQNPL